MASFSCKSRLKHNSSPNFSKGPFSISPFDASRGQFGRRPAPKVVHGQSLGFSSSHDPNLPSCSSSCEVSDIVPICCCWLVVGLLGPVLSRTLINCDLSLRCRLSMKPLRLEGDLLLQKPWCSHRASLRALEVVSYGKFCGSDSQVCGKNAASTVQVRVCAFAQSSMLYSNERPQHRYLYLSSIDRVHPCCAASAQQVEFT